MFIDLWRPVTSDFGLVEAPLEPAVAEFLCWQRSLGIESSERSCSSLSSALASLAPLSAEMRRSVFVATGSSWTAFFQSGILGSDPFPPMNMLSRLLGVRAMRVCSTPVNATWPANIWEVYAPAALGGVEPLLYKRAVCAANDGGRWTFDQSGTPFGFELLSAYSRKRKKDRFTREMLEEYLAHFGLRPFDEEFYDVSDARPAALVERAPRWANPPLEFTFEAVQAGVPWAR